MAKNTDKGNAYQLVLSNLKSCAETDDVFHLIGLIAASESIMSDRLSAFLGGTRNERFITKRNQTSYVSFGDLIKFSKKELKVGLKIKPKQGNEIVTTDLHSNIKRWNQQRNKAIHSVCKSRNEVSHKSETELFDEVKSTCLTGYRLVRLLLKWSQQNEKKTY